MIKTNIESLLESARAERDALTALPCKYADEQLALDELMRAIEHLVKCLALLTV